VKRTLILIFLAAVAATSSFGQIIDRPAATVNLTKPEFISVKQLEQRIEQYKQLSTQGLTGIPTDPLLILDAMIQELLINQAAAEAAAAGSVYVSDQMVSAQIAAVRKNLDQQQGSPVSNQQFQELILRQTGMGYDGYQESIREQLVTQEYIKFAKRELFAEMPQPTDRQIEEQYRKNATSFTNPEMVRISEIFVETRNLAADQKQKALERAESALRNIRNGEGSFEDIVLQFTDDPSTRYNGGDKGFFAGNDPRIQGYGAAYFDEIFSIDVGKISSVIESRLGYHIVKVTDHRDPKLLTLADPINPIETQTVREFIRALLLQEIQNRVLQQAIKELTDELTERAEIRIFEENIEQ
jgi:peptidyl-prolyl cis-trans isomerase SurA